MLTVPRQFLCWSFPLSVRSWFHMWCFCCPYLFLISPSFGASGGLCFVILAFPGYFLYFKSSVILLSGRRDLVIRRRSLACATSFYQNYFVLVVVVFVLTEPMFMLVHAKVNAQYICYNPAGTQLWNNVDSTLSQCQDVASTLIRRCCTLTQCWIDEVSTFCPAEKVYFPTV